MRKQKHRKKGIPQGATRTRPLVISDKPAHDDPHDAINQELLGIWLSISRLRQLIQSRPPGSYIVPLQRQPTHNQAVQKKARHKAA
jgi:hypothetical protein